MPLSAFELKLEIESNAAAKTKRECEKPNDVGFGGSAISLS